MITLKIPQQWRFAFRGRFGRFFCGPHSRSAGPNLIRHVFEAQGFAFGHDHHPLNYVLELANIARPRIFIEERQHALVESQPRAAALFGEML